MGKMDTSVVDKAVRFAVEKHSGSSRKGSDTPYIVHPMEAAAIVAGISQDQKLIAAALLHDTLEDTETMEAEVLKQFGPDILELVKAESEDKQKERDPEESWKDRKQETIDELKTASYESRLLVLADKLSNIRAMERDWAEKGMNLWDRFNMKDPALHAWYYGAIADILGADPQLKDTQACREYVERVRAVFGQWL